MNFKIEYFEVVLYKIILLIPRQPPKGPLDCKRALWTFLNSPQTLFAEIPIESLMLMALLTRPIISKRRRKLNMADASMYDQSIEESLLGSPAARAMGLGYKYFPELQNKYFSEGYVVKIGWSNNTRSMLEYSPMDTYFQGERSDLAIQYSSYLGETLDNIEDLVCSIVGCEKKKESLSFEISSTSESTAIPDPFLQNEVVVEKGYNRYLFHKEKVYIGLSGVSKNIYTPISWEIYIDSCTEFHKPPYIMFGPNKEISPILGHHLHKDYVINIGNDHYSIPTQLINLLHGNVYEETPWVKLSKKYSALDKVVLNIDTSNCFKKFVVFEGFDKDWNLIWKNKKILKTDGDSRIINKKQILRGLF